ncbi:MAG: hypothetical protein WA728_12465 [Xanthobacteraceae bacterium]
MAGGFQSAGRRRGARNRLSTSFLEKLAVDFEEHGEGVIKIARMEEPVNYLRLVASVLPKEFELIDTRLQELSDDDIAQLISELKRNIQSRPTIDDVGRRDGEALN